MIRKKKKVFLLMATVIMLFYSMDLQSFARDSETHYSSDYQKYNFETGEISYYQFKDLPISHDENFSPGYFPNGVILDNDVEIAPTAVVGVDERTSINVTTEGPYCNTVYLETTYNSEPNMVYIGTGFVIGPNAVATAAHCVYNKDKGGYASSVKVVPAKNGTVEPYGSETVTVSSDNVVVSTKFINSPGPDHDWAVIELSTDIGNTTGWLGLRWQSDSYNGTSVTNTGYPAEVNGKDGGKLMYRGDGTIKKSNTYTLIGDWDASAGNSGGPVYANYSSTTGYTAIGILTSGSADSTFNKEYPTAYSTATRITKDIYNLFVSYRE